MTSPLPDETLIKLDEAVRLAKAVDKAVMMATPDIIELQVAAVPSGVVVISGVTLSANTARLAVEAAQEVVGVHQVINSLTVMA